MRDILNRITGARAAPGGASGGDHIERRALFPAADRENRALPNLFFLAHNESPARAARAVSREHSVAGPYRIRGLTIDCRAAAARMLPVQPMKIKSYYRGQSKTPSPRPAQELGAEAMLLNSRKAPIRSPPPGRVRGGSSPCWPPATSRPTPRRSPPKPRARPRSGGQRPAFDRGGRTEEGTGGHAPRAHPHGLCARSSGPACRRTWPTRMRKLGGGGSIAGTGAGNRAGGASGSRPRARSRAPAGADRPRGISACPRGRADRPVHGRAAVWAAEARPRIVALVGPPGSRQDHHLVKLAVNYGLSARRPVLLLSMDTYRVAAAEQLRSYAAILGVGFQVLETVGALAQTIEENRGKELIFIDTPGLGPGRWTIRRPGALSGHARRHRHAPGAAGLDEGRRSYPHGGCVRDACGRTGCCLPSWTKPAPTGRFSTRRRALGKPLSFFAAGQRIPEDLEAASAPRLLDLVFRAVAGQVRGGLNATRE